MKQSFISWVLEETNNVLFHLTFYPVSLILNVLHAIVHTLMKVNTSAALAFYRYGCPRRQALRDEQEARDREEVKKARAHFESSMRELFGGRVEIDDEKNTITVNGYGKSETENEDGIPSSPSGEDQETKQTN